MRYTQRTVGAPKGRSRKPRLSFLLERRTGVSLVPSLAPGISRPVHLPTIRRLRGPPTSSHCDNLLAMKTVLLPRLFNYFRLQLEDPPARASLVVDCPPFRFFFREGPIGLLCHDS